MTKAEGSSQELGGRGQRLSKKSGVGSMQFTYCCLLFTVYCLLFFTACASTKGPVTLVPVPTVSPEYVLSGRTIAFSNKDVKISLLPLKSSEVKKMLAGKDVNNPLAEILAAPQYLAFRLDMENSSKAKIMYNPALTTLFDNTMGVHKPLDYTDMYSLVESSPNPESTLNKMKGMFYDLTTQLEPGEKASRFLLFSGMDEEASEITITMKEIYVGTSAMTVSFGFRITLSPLSRQKKRLFKVDYLSLQ